MNSGSQHSPQKYFPAFETTPVCETSAEYLEDRLEILDLTERIEALLMLLTEVGPELDAFVRATLADELHTLLYHLGIDMNSQDAFDDYKRKRDEMRERVEQVIDRDEVDTVLRKLGVPEQDHVSLRAAIEKVLILRTLGRSDTNIFRALARTYHPDVTLLNPQDAETIFKLVQQYLLDQSGEFLF